SQAMVDTLVGCGVNRVSLGVQSFVDHEAASVGRLHKREIVLDDVACLRAAGISNINIDLIAGLPHQTRESWDCSLNDLIALDAHLMLVSSAMGGVRFSNPDALEKYIAAAPQERVLISPGAALQEVFFLGLRMNRGVDLGDVAQVFGQDAVANYAQTIAGSV